MGYDSKGILVFNLKYEHVHMHVCNQLHQFGQIYKLLSNATVNIIEIVRNCVRWR